MRTPNRILWLWVFWDANVSFFQLDILFPVALIGTASQSDVRTIEGELFKALVAAGAVSKDNSDDPVKVRMHYPL
jgi:hypothetical protein